MRRGEIWWGDVPGLGPRPVLVLTRDVAIPLLTRVVVAPLTTNVRGVPSEVVLEEEDGVPRRSAVSLDNLRAVEKHDLSHAVGRLSLARMEEVCAALRFAVAC